MKYELISMIATIVSAVASVGAVVLAYLIFRRQRNISLFQRRIEIMNAYDHYLYDVLTDKDWDGSYEPINKYQTSELVTLFGQEFSAVHMEVLNTADHVADCNKRLKEAEASTACGEAEVDEHVKELKKERDKRIEEALRFYHEVVDRYYGNVFRI